MKKILIISGWAPPMRGAGPVYLGRLLSYFPKGSYSIFTKEQGAFSNNLKTGEWLPANYYFLNYPDKLHGTSLEKSDLITINTSPTSLVEAPKTFTHKIRSSALYEAILFVPRVFRITKQASQALKVEGSQTILATSDDGYFLIAGFLLSFITKKPLDILLFDIYKGNRFSSIKKLVARVMERPIMTRARKVFVTNELTRNILTEEYGIEPIIVRHSTRQYKSSLKVDTNIKVILYSGNIDWPQVEGLKLLVKVVNKMSGGKLRILTQLSPEYLKSRGLVGKNVEFSTSKISDVPKQISQADILYLPLSIIFPKDRLIETALPYKMTEYLASSRPILVHAPNYSVLYQYAKQEGFGLVVDDMNENTLKTAILKILTDKSLRESLSDNSERIFLKNHNIDEVGPKFVKYFS